MRVQNNGYKEAHQSQENNVWSVWVSQQKDKKYKKYQTEVIELKNTVTEIKVSKEGFSIRLDQMKEKISKLKGKAVEIIQSEQEKKKKKNKKMKIA